MTTTNSNMNSKYSEIKTILRSLLISEGSRDVTIRRLNGMYKDMEGINIPFREFNYFNLTEFLHSLNDTLRLRYNRENELCAYHIDTEKSAHISSLVSRQKKPSKKNKTNNHRPYSGYSSNNYSQRRNYTQRSSTNYTQRTSQNYGQKVTSNHLQNVTSNRLQNVTSNHLQNVTSNHTQKVTPNYKEILNQILKELKYSSYSTTNNGVRKSEILSKVKNCLSSEFSNVYTIRDLNEHLYYFSNKLIIENDYIYFKDNCVKNKSPYKASTNINTNIITSNGNCMSASKTKNDTSKIMDNKENSLETSSSNNIVSERTKIRLEKLIQKHPEGIWCSELPNLYKFDYNIDLEYNLAFNSITEFVAALPDIFKVIEPPNMKKQMVVYAKTPPLNTNHQTKTLAAIYNFDEFIATDPEPVPVKLSTGVSQKLIPDGVMNLNETVEQICVTSLVCEEYIEVNISEIFTPSFFWITLRKNKKKIKTLMSELEEFYNQNDISAYKVPQLLLQSGLNIACIYSNIWHRGIVKKVKPDGFVVILFYDYGTIKTYNPHEIYFLNKKFSALPAQAIPCGLYNIKPVGSNEWPCISINKFIDKIWEIPLIAIISNINEENNSMMITLTDTSDDLTDLHINDWMVESELAEWGKMINTVPVDRMCIYDELQLIEIREGIFKESLTSNKSNINKENLENVNTTALSSLSTNKSSTIPNTSYNTSNVVSLVKEQMHLTKQTNTIAQAILLNMPLNNSQVLVNNNRNEKEINDICKNCIDIKESSSQNIDKNITENLNKINNSNSINQNISEINSNYFGNDNIYKKEINLNENQKDYFDNRLSIESLNSYEVDFALIQLDNANYENECCILKNYLYKQYSLNFEYINYTKEKYTKEKTVIDYDSCSFDHGTPCFEIKTVETKPNIDIIHSSYVVDKNIYNSEIDNCKNIKNETEKHSEEINEGNNITRDDNSHRNLSSVIGFNNESSNSMYIVTQLSERCEKKLIYLFHLDNQGWISTIEFVDAFTNLKDQRIMFKLLNILDCNVNYKYLTRDAEPKLFSELDESKMKVPREKNNKILDNTILILMPLKDMLQVLVRLDFLNAQMLKAALPLMKEHNKEGVEDILYEQHNNKILFDVLNLLVQYKQFIGLPKTSS